MDALPPHLRAHVLSFLPPADLARLACTSRALRTLAYDETLWRRHALASPSAPLRFRGSWRAAVANEASIGADTSTAPPDVFLQCPVLHRRYARGLLRPAEYVADAVHPSLAVLDASAGKVRLDMRQPCAVANADRSWSAAETWTQTSLSSVGEPRSEAKLQLAQTCAKTGARHRAPLGWFLTAYCRNQRDDVPLYIFDPDFARASPSLLKDYGGGAPSFLREHVDWYDACLADPYDVAATERLRPPLRPPYRWFSVGPCRSGVSWHTDPPLTAAWNYVSSGRKLWFFYPPNRTPPALWHEPDGPAGGMAYQLPGGALRWLYEIYHTLPATEAPLAHVQCPHEVVYVPPGWYHMTVNLDDIATIGVTQNFVSRATVEAAVLELDREAATLQANARLPCAELSLKGALGSHIGYREQRARLGCVWTRRDEADRDLMRELGKRLYAIDEWRACAAAAAQCWASATKIETTADDPADWWPVGSSANVCFALGPCFVKILTPSLARAAPLLPRVADAVWGASAVREVACDAVQSYMEAFATNALREDGNPISIWGTVNAKTGAAIWESTNHLCSMGTEISGNSAFYFVASARISCGLTLARATRDGSPAWHDRVAESVGALLRRLHMVPIPTNWAIWSGSPGRALVPANEATLWAPPECALVSTIGPAHVPFAWGPFVTFLRMQRAHAVHRVLESLPHLTEAAVDAYLPSDPAVLCLGIEADVTHVHDPSVVHGDAHAENVMLRCEDPTSVCLVDLGDAGMGDPLYDVVALGADVISAGAWPAFARGAARVGSIPNGGAGLTTSYRLCCYAIMHASPSAFRLWLRSHDCHGVAQSQATLGEVESACFAEAADSWDGVADSCL